MTDSLKTNERGLIGQPAPAAPPLATKMQIGVDSFAARFEAGDASADVTPSDSLRHLVDRIVLADQAGLDIFGVGEHHRREFLDSPRRSSSPPPPRAPNASASPVLLPS